MNKTTGFKKWSVALLCVLMLSACSSQAATSTTAANTAAATTTAAQTSASSDADVQTASLDLSEGVEYKTDDAYTDWKSGDYTEVKLNGSSAEVSGPGASADGGTITITAAGTYVFSGKLADGQIVVDVPDKGTARLVLNGAEISSSTGSAIYVKEAGKAIVSLEEGTENIVSDAKAYADAAASGDAAGADSADTADASADASTDEDSTDAPNAAIYSKDDLTINGTGKLTVQGNYNDGITSRDKLKVTGGTLNVKAVDDAIIGRDLLAVQEGDVTIDAGGHGLKASNDAADELGIIAIDGGSFNIKTGEDALHSSGGVRIAGGDLEINAGDDGVHADVALAIKGGTIHIAGSNEGIEAPNAVIDDGEIVLAASDDGVNIAGGNDSSAAEGGQGGGQGGQGGPESGSSSSNMLTVNGGYLYVDSQGDGLDANGSIAMTGGTVIVSGPTANNNAALDYDGTFELTGGVLLATGSSGMAQAPSDTSTQAGIMMTYPQAQQAGTLVNLSDSAGKSIITFAPAKDYQTVFISTPEMKKDGSYTLNSGGSATGNEVNGLYAGDYTGGTKVLSFDASSLITWLNESGVTEARTGMGGMGGRGMGGGGRMRGDGGQPPQDGQAPADAPQGQAPADAPQADTQAQ